MQVIHDAEDFRFYAPIGDEEAELTYTYPEDQVMDFDYTFVPESARNQGLSGEIVKAALDFAREQGYKVIPSCPVVDAYVKRHPQYQDLLT